MKLGIARAVGAVVFSVVIGLMMHLIFRKEEEQKAAAQMALPEEEVKRPLWQNSIYFFTMVAILVFANWGKPMHDTGLWHAIYSAKWIVTSLFSVVLAVILVAWFDVKWWKMLFAALPAAILAFIFPKAPNSPPFSPALLLR